MIKDSMIRQIAQEKAGAIVFQEKKWLEFKARCRDVEMFVLTFKVLRFYTILIF